MTRKGPTSRNYRKYFFQNFSKIFCVDQRPQVEQAEKSVAVAVRLEQERQREREMKEELVRLHTSVLTVTEKINDNQGQMKEIGEKLDSLVG